MYEHGLFVVDVICLPSETVAQFLKFCPHYGDPTLFFCFQKIIPIDHLNEIRSWLRKRENGFLSDDETKRIIKKLKRTFLDSNVKNEIGRRLSLIKAPRRDRSNFLTQHLRITCGYILPD